MAIVLLIVALAIGGGLSVISGQVEHQKFKETQKALDEAKEAIVGYSVSHLAALRPYLPCPDRTTAGPPGTANDGVEDLNAGGTDCAVFEGNLPWVTLGLVGLDGWGNRIRYRVPNASAFTSRTTGFDLATNPALAIELVVNNAVGTRLVTDVPFVLVSHGPNGWGAISGSGTAIGAPPGASLNEAENTDGDTIFVSNPPVATGLAGGEFDDIVTWLPSNLLFTRMLQAGVCVKTAACP
jgi:type II secretory pathway pseudopilin PulG